MSTSVEKLAGSCGTAMRYYERPEVELDLDGIDSTLRYYSDSTEPSDLVFTTAWGRAATQLGINDGVNAQTFHDLWTGVVDGNQVVVAGRNHTNKKTGEVSWTPRNSAFDLTFTTPKSMAEALVRATPEERALIVKDFVDSVQVTFQRGVEDYARLARPVVPEAPRPNTKQQGSVTERQQANLIAFPVVEYVARPTAEQRKRGSRPDPHLHMHVLVMSLCEKDGNWYTADEYGLKNPNAGPYREAMFANELTQRLERRGYEIDFDDFDFARDGQIRWELAKSDPKLRDYWSTNTQRGHEIRRRFELENGRPMSKLEYRIEMDSTRLKKTDADSAMDHRPVFERWESDAAQHGFDVSPITRKKYTMPRAAMVSLRKLDERLMGSNGLHIEKAVFSFETIGVAVQRCSVGLGLSDQQLQRRTAELQRDLILVSDDREPLARRFTTPLMLETEQHIDDHFVERAEAKSLVNISGVAGSGKTRIAGEAVKALRCKPAGKSLTAEQRAAFDAITEMLPDGVDQVISVSTAAAVAERTGAKVGADRHGSVESVVHQVKHGQITPTPSTLLVLDEAGQMDTLRVAKLIDAMGPEAKWVVLGDTKQLPAISAGGWYASQLEKNGSFELRENKRQRDQEDRLVADLVRNGRSEEALRNLDDRGRLHVADDPTGVVGQVMEKYEELANRPGVRDSDIRIVVEESNAVTDQLNRFVQYRRLQSGELDATQRATLRENPRFESSRSWDVYRGDQVVFLRSYKGRGRRPVRNGTEGVVKGVSDTHVAVELHEGARRSVVEVPREVAAFAPAYAQHNFKYQGHEAAFILGVPSADVGSANSGYTLVSRGELETHLFLSHGDDADDDPVRALADSWNARVSKETALAEMRRNALHTDPGAKVSFKEMRVQQNRIKTLAVVQAASSPRVANEVAASRDFDALVAKHSALRDFHRRADDILWDAVIGVDAVRAADPADSIGREFDRLTGPISKAYEADRAALEAQRPSPPQQQLGRSVSPHL